MRTVLRGAVATTAFALGIAAWSPYGAAVAAEPVDLGGQPIEGSTDSRDATPIEAGLWSATLGPDPQHFVYERQIEDSTVHIGIVGAPQTTDSDGVQVFATADTPEDDALDCGSDYETSSSITHAVVGAHVIVGNEDDGGACRGADSIAIAVDRYYSSVTADLPVAIKVVEEAPVAQAEGPPEESVELSYDRPQPVEPADGPTGSASFDDAPVIDAREKVVTVSTEVSEGDQLLWRVPLDWGDQLVVRADLPALPADEAERLGYPSPAVRLQLVEPDRDTFVQTRSEDYAEDSYGGEEAKELYAATYPLRYANRYTDVAPTLPGDNWVSVAVGFPTEQRDPIDVPMELTFEVTRTDVPSPTYKAAVLAQGGGDGPDGYGPETPYLVGDGEFAAVASGNPFAPEDEDDSWWGARRAAGLGLGLVSLVCCAVGAVWLRRASRG